MLSRIDDVLPLYKEELTLNPNTGVLMSKKKPNLIKIQPRFEVGSPCYFLTDGEIMISTIKQIMLIHKMWNVPSEEDPNVIDNRFNTEWTYMIKGTTHWVTDRYLFISPEEATQHMLDEFYNRKIGRAHV